MRVGHVIIIVVLIVWSAVEVNTLLTELLTHRQLKETTPTLYFICLVWVFNSFKF